MYAFKTEANLADSDEEHVQKKIRELLAPSDTEELVHADPAVQRRAAADEKAQTLLANAQDLNTDIELLEDQLYGISGSLGLDLDFLRSTDVGDSDLLQLMNASQAGVDTPNRANKRSHTADLSDPSLFFNHDLQAELHSAAQSPAAPQIDDPESLEREILSLEELLE